ncbi:MAG: YifB family Mg chelatase-like AAA ATPase [Firmicutes bacterium]|nr:YifB family Mg chelatase-like AAA ATPase [Bacillota bacterium]
MVSVIKSCTMNGICGEITKVECDISRGMPMLNIVGLPDTAVKESKERLRAAINNSGLTFPLSKRITINLSPAGTKKEGTHMDLAMALSLLVCADDIYNERIGKYIVLGELSLDGRVNSAGRITPILMSLKRDNFKSVIIPKEDVEKAIIIEGIDIYPVETLYEAYGFLKGTVHIDKISGRRPERIAEKEANGADFSEVKGREEAKRAVEICMSGFHNLLLTGPPGCGKSMIAKRIPSVLPEMSYEEMMEVMSLYSISNDETYSADLRYKRPFRDPAANISLSAMIGGGGGMPKPGEISLAHNGVLFLDEMPEFRKDVLEALRQPLEDEKVSISRASGKTTYPCKFIMIGARNPCPCGHLNDPLYRCSCTSMQIKKYKDRISGPIMDRFDIFVDMTAYNNEKEYAFEDSSAGKDSKSMKKSICLAGDIQAERYKKESFKYNSQLKGQALQKYCCLDGEGKELYAAGCSALKVSKRGADKVLKVARTIADLEGEEFIKSVHLAEAFQFRRRDEAEV